MYRKKRKYARLTFSELSVHLSAHDVEQVGWRGHVGNLHVAVLVLSVDSVGGGEHSWVLVTQLEVPFYSSGGVFGTLAVITVWQRHDKSRPLEPLGFTRCDELIDDTLSVVGEVTELSLPHHERIGRGQGVAVFEAQAAKRISTS